MNMTLRVEDYLDLDTVAEQLKCNKATLLKAINDGELKAVEGVWRGYRTTSAWVQEWLDRKTVNLDTAGGE